MSFTPNRYLDEHSTVEDYAAALNWSPSRAENIAHRTADLLTLAQGLGHKMGEIENFLRQYGLDTKEGVALVCLAEALLRIPDAETANDLIKDKITAVNWLQGKAETSDLLVRAARFGLSFTKSTLDSVLGNLGAPAIRLAVIQGIRMMGKQFVLGETIDAAIKNAGTDMARGYALSFDMLGEGARTAQQAESYMAAYRDAIDAVAAAKAAGAITDAQSGISVKLSALHPRYSALQEHTCRSALTQKLLTLAQECARHNITLTMDAEETERLTLSLEIFRDVAADPSLNGWNGLGLAVQAYQKYAPDLMDHVIQIARDTNRILRVRLVKGAYWDTEIKRAQQLGLPDYPVFTRKVNTDVSYLLCAQKLLDSGNVYPMFATHNAHTVAAVLAMAGGRDKTTFEFQRLHGMGAALHDVLVRDRLANVTIYAPVGTHEDLLAYLVRRLLENGANSSFVNKLHHGTVDTHEDPVALALAHPTRRHKALTLPRDLYGPDRRNSLGYDITQQNERAALLAAPMPSATLPDPNIDAAFATARESWGAWNALGGPARADILNKYADSLEGHTPALMQLLMSEGRKTWADAVAEIREAVDFARYYASLACTQFDANGTPMPGPTGESNRLLHQGRGVFVCISPWNFPLAIFTGQVAAALLAGNAVLAKPAEQTPKIAWYAVTLMHQAGVPRDVVQLIVGDGSVGAALVAHGDVAGVAFTGSTDVARSINRTLAAKNGAIVPLIAETGGQNAMIVDSSALPEQVCDDVILSAFGSAGQRCSALRVLYVQNDIADKLIGMIAGAVAELNVGDPSNPATDIGPVIDMEAYNNLVNHESYLSSINAKLIARAPIASNLAPPYFAPVVYEIDAIAQLPGEVFGPILHIIRFAARDIGTILDQVNATGYGLTFGVHTRIDTRMDGAAGAIAAGNVYINRNMIGAVVGTQPFGGSGLSGTGPKAGGPHYLLRFASEKTITRNTAASGGNIALVAGGD